MGILDIENRTENWKTARSFAPFFGDEVACQELAQRLLEPLGEGLKQDTWVKIELFWKGGRDYAHENMLLGKGISEPYERFFDGLRKDLQDFGEATPNEFNYCPDAPKGVDYLRTNILNTEIDIVLETPRHLFIGEAKDESSLGRDEKYVLMHQLIRQYVTATILTAIIRSRHKGKGKKQIVPFIVANKKKLYGVRNDAQVEFMIHKGWLKEDNILSWEDIETIRRSVER